MEDTFKIKLSGYDKVDKTVKAQGNSGRVYVPKAWIGKEVTVILREPIE